MRLCKKYILEDIVDKDMNTREIETAKINTRVYHPDQMYMAKVDITPHKFEIEYGRKKQEAISKLRVLVWRRYKLKLI